MGDNRCPHELLTSAGTTSRVIHLWHMRSNWPVTSCRLRRVGVASPQVAEKGSRETQSDAREKERSWAVDDPIQGNVQHSMHKRSAAA